MHPSSEIHSHEDGLILRLVAFKWLMTGEGWHVDLPRLQVDEGYARECLRCGMSSHSDVVRKESLGLWGVLDR